MLAQRTRDRLKALVVAVTATAGLVTIGLVPNSAAAATPKAKTTAAADACTTAPNWQQGTYYNVGAIVKYRDGNYYIAEHANPGYDPTVSTWFWNPHTCSPGNENPGEPGPFVVTEAQFNQMFPNRNPFYTYSGLTAALSAYPAFANTGSDTLKKQEAAAFLANISHETGGLFYIKEIDERNYPIYCDRAQPYGCPAGQAKYYGRGPIMLSWNFNYKTVGDWLGIDLLNDPDLVEKDPAVAMMTALWYWNTQDGPGPVTAHDAMISGAGFGQTIRAINGALECDGGHPAQVQSRVNRYKNFTQILGVPAGPNLSC